MIFYPEHYYECPLCHRKYDEYSKCETCINSHPSVEMKKVLHWNQELNVPYMIEIAVGDKFLQMSCCQHCEYDDEV